MVATKQHGVAHYGHVNMCIFSMQEADLKDAVLVLSDLLEIPVRL